MIGPARARASLWCLAILVAAPDTAVARETAKPDYRGRAISKSEGPVRVSVSVLSAEESLDTYGAPLAERLIQPVWIEVENRGTDALWLLSPGLDPEFFTPSEAAEAFAGGSKRADAVDRQVAFRELAFQSPVPPGTTVSGFVLTNLHEGVKLLQIDLVGNALSHSFSMVTTVPGLRVDYERSEVFRREIYTADQIADFTDEAAFRAALRQLPCCVTNAEGSKSGDPLNLIPGYESFRKARELLAAPDEPVTNVTDLDDLRTALESLPHITTTSTGNGGPLNVVLVGSIEDIAAAGARRGYRRDVRDVDVAFAVFGRPPDFVSRKKAHSGASSIWVRAWRAPVSFLDKPVFIAQVARPVGGRFSGSADSPQMSPDVDEVRNAFLQSHVYSGGLESVGFLAPADAVPRETPRSLADGSHYFTDGVRAVLFFSIRPRTFADVRRLDWEPFLERAERDIRKGPAQ